MTGGTKNQFNGLVGRPAGRMERRLGGWPIASSFSRLLTAPSAASPVRVPAQGRGLLRQRGARHRIDADAVRPAGRRDGDVAGIAAGAAERLGEADGDQAPASGTWSRFVTPSAWRSCCASARPRLRGSASCRCPAARGVEQDLALEMQELQRREAHAGERLLPEPLSVRPALRPVRAHHHHGAGRDAAVLLFEGRDVGDLDGSPRRGRPGLRCRSPPAAAGCRSPAGR